MRYMNGEFEGQPDNLNMLDSLSERNKNLLKTIDNMEDEEPDNSVDWAGLQREFHPEKRCIKCQNLCITPHDSMIIVQCVNKIIQGAELGIEEHCSISFYREDDIPDFLDHLEKTCDVTLPDGSLGFKEVEYMETKEGE